MSEFMLDRLMHHGYGLHHAVPGGEGGGAAMGLRLAFAWNGLLTVLRRREVDVEGVGR